MCVVTTAACYTGTRAAHDVNLAWRGHARVDLEARLGAPRVTTVQPDGTTLARWTHRGHHVVDLPGGGFKLDVTPTRFDVRAQVRAGTVQAVEYDLAAAVLDPSGTVLSFDSGWLAAGIPRGLNARTGLILGLPGNAALAPGGIAAVSFAVVRAGSFVLDLRFDTTVSTSRYRSPVLRREHAHACSRHRTCGPVASPLGNGCDSNPDCSFESVMVRRS